MNDNQKKILIVMIFVIVIMFLFPPFQIYSSDTTSNEGYRLIFSPPTKYTPTAHRVISATVNLSLLSLQCVGVLVVGGLALFLFKNDITRIKIYEDNFVKSNIQHTNERMTNNEIEIAASTIINKEKNIPASYYPWRRYFARFIDTSLLSLLMIFGISVFVGVFLPNNAEAFSKIVENKIMFCIIFFISWIPLEAILLFTIGSTPAKWLFGISVKTSSGQKLSFKQALKRSCLIAFQGYAIGIPIILLFTQAAAYDRLTKTGSTLWDDSIQSIVIHKTWGVWQTIICYIAVFVTLSFLSILNKM